jgi:hypothetical protein
MVRVMGGIWGCVFDANLAEAKRLSPHSTGSLGCATIRKSWTSGLEKKIAMVALLLACDDVD